MNHKENSQIRNLRIQVTENNRMFKERVYLNKKKAEKKGYSKYKNKAVSEEN